MKLFFRKRPSSATTRKSIKEPSDQAKFIQRITHDMQGDFFVLTSACLLLKRQVERKEDPMPLIDHLTENCQLYKYKLSNFIEYTRAGAGLTRTLREPVNIRELLATVITEYDFKAAEKNILIDLLVSEEIPAHIITDEFRIAQIAANLLLNAIAFSPQGGSVFVHVGQKGDRWEFVVRDKGEGMTAGQLDNIFNTSPESREFLKNPAGLGLLVTRYLAEDLLDGKMHVTSEPRAGTQITIQLPLY
jgi:chemotaxis family two-component system sensor kinase Cph1